MTEEILALLCSWLDRVEQKVAAFGVNIAAINRHLNDLSARLHWVECIVDSVYPD